METHVTTMYANRHLPLALAITLFASGCHDYTIWPQYAIGEDAVCVAETQS